VACYAELGIEIVCGSCPYVIPGGFVVDARVDRVSMDFDLAKAMDLT
jgi:hypothetical protein